MKKIIFTTRWEYLDLMNYIVVLLSIKDYNKISTFRNENPWDWD